MVQSSCRTDLEQVDLAKEATTDGDECLLGPLMEPVNTRRVRHGRELTTTDS